MKLSAPTSLRQSLFSLAVVAVVATPAWAQTEPKSAAPVKELAQLLSSRKIESIQVDTKGAVEAIGTITRIITQVNDISNSIASAVEEQNATTNEMSRNVTEAARGASEIAKNIAGVAEAAQSTSHGAGDSQRAAQQLTAMSSELRELVAQFKY